jgi:hypothetical protein
VTFTTNCEAYNDACAASGALIVTAEVGGLHHRYDRQAA